MKKNEEKIEKVGNVTLNLNYYSGEDLYSEGTNEDELLDIVKNYRDNEYEKVIENSRSWSKMYHLSHIRENIVFWLPMWDNQSVLEIGSGCGAITGALSRMAGKVTCIELSKKRSLINANRNRESDNVEIIVGNFKDIEPEIEEKYDYVTLIGVLEYADAYIGGDNPFVNMLKAAASHLKEDGKLFIAIENKYGLKYFAGCKEDHTCKYYDGIEGYSEDEKVRTFSRDTLRNMLEEIGLKSEFFYPYPDYKLPNTIYSDRYLPTKGELYNNIRNFDNDRLITFDEDKVFDALVEDGQFPMFSNSFAIIATRKDLRETEPEIPLFVKFSDERSSQFRQSTLITLENGISRKVYKSALTAKGNKHISEIYDNFEELTKIYEGTKLVPNKCTFIKGKENAPQIAGVSNKARDMVLLEYLSGVSLESYLDRLNGEKQYGHMLAVIKEFCDLVNKTSNNGEFRMSEDFKQVFGAPKFSETYKASPIANFDMIFSNIVLNREKLEEGDWNVLDYEWMFKFPVPAKFIIYRALFYYEQGRENTGFFEFLKGQEKTVYSQFGISNDEAEIFKEMEHNFQLYIISGMASLEVMRYIMPTNAVRIDKFLEEGSYLRNLNTPKVYYSCGDGFSEENRLHLIADISSDNIVSLSVPITNNIVKLRVDPTEYPCILHVNQIRVKMQKGIDLSVEKYVINGYNASNDTFIFDTDDAQIIMDIPANAVSLLIEYQVRMLPEEMFRDFRDVLMDKCRDEKASPSVVKKGLKKLHLSNKEILPEGFRYNQKRR